MKAGVGPPGRLWHQTRVERFPSAAPQADQVFVVIDRQRVPDAAVAQVGGLDDPFAHKGLQRAVDGGEPDRSLPTPHADRKSTRLNSSHGYISSSLFSF